MIILTNFALLITQISVQLSGYIIKVYSFVSLKKEKTENVAEGGERRRRNMKNVQNCPTYYDHIKKECALPNITVTSLIGQICK